MATAKEKLWRGLVETGGYTKSYDDFNKQFSNEGAIRKLYNGCVEHGVYTKSFEDFNGQFFADIPTAKASVQQAEQMNDRGNAVVQAPVDRSKFTAEDWMRTMKQGKQDIIRNRQIVSENRQVANQFNPDKVGSLSLGQQPDQKGMLERSFEMKRVNDELSRAYDDYTRGAARLYGRGGNKDWSDEERELAREAALESAKRHNEFEGEELAVIKDAVDDARQRELDKQLSKVQQSHDNIVFIYNNAFLKDKDGKIVRPLTTDELKEYNRTIKTAAKDVAAATTEYDELYKEIHERYLGQERERLGGMLTENRAEIADFKKENDGGNLNTAYAEKINRDTEEILNAPDKYMADRMGFFQAAGQHFKGIGKGLTNEDNVPFLGGVTEYARYTRVADIIRKSNDDMSNLSKDEKALLGSYLAYLEAADEVESEQAMSYSSGKSGAMSMTFMLEMMMFAGIEKAVGKGAAKGAAKLAEKLARIKGVSMSDKLRRGLLKVGEKGLEGTAQFMAEANGAYTYGPKGSKVAVMPKAKGWQKPIINAVNAGIETGVTPRTYAEVEKARAAKLATTGEDLTPEEIAWIGYNQWGEYFSETGFNELNKATIGRLMPSWAQKWIDKRGKWTRFTSGRFTSLPDEFAEEYEKGVMDIIVGDVLGNGEVAEQGRQLFTAEGTKELAASFWFQTMLMGGATAAMMKYKENQLNKKRAVLAGELAKSLGSKEDADGMLSVVETSEDFGDFQDKLNVLFGILKEGKNLKTDEAVKIIEEYAGLYAEFNANMNIANEAYNKMTAEEKAKFSERLRDGLNDVKDSRVEQELVARIEKKYGMKQGGLYALTQKGSQNLTDTEMRAVAEYYEEHVRNGMLRKDIAAMQERVRERVGEDGMVTSAMLGNSRVYVKSVKDGICAYVDEDGNMGQTAMSNLTDVKSESAQEIMNETEGQMRTVAAVTSKHPTGSLVVYNGQLCQIIDAIGDDPATATQVRAQTIDPESGDIVPVDIPMDKLAETDTAILPDGMEVEGMTVRGIDDAGNVVIEDGKGGSMELSVMEFMSMAHKSKVDLVKTIDDYIRNNGKSQEEAEAEERETERLREEDVAEVINGEPLQPELQAEIEQKYGLEEGELERVAKMPVEEQNVNQKAALLEYAERINAEKVATQDENPQTREELNEAIKVALLELARKYGISVRFSEEEKMAKDKDGKEGKVEGEFNLDNKSVTIYLNNLPSVERAAIVFAHEVIGHYGLRRLFEGHEQELGMVLGAVLNGMTAEDYKKYSTIASFNPGWKDMSGEERNALIADEYVASVAEEYQRRKMNGTLDNKFMRKVTYMVEIFRNMLGKILGMNKLAMSREDVMYLICANENMLWEEGKRDFEARQAAEEISEEITEEVNAEMKAKIDGVIERFKGRFDRAKKIAGWAAKMKKYYEEHKGSVEVAETEGEGSPVGTNDDPELAEMVNMIKEGVALNPDFINVSFKELENAVPAAQAVIEKKRKALEALRKKAGTFGIGNMEALRKNAKEIEKAEREVAKAEARLDETVKRFNLFLAAYGIVVGGEELEVAHGLVEEVKKRVAEMMAEEEKMRTLGRDAVTMDRERKEIAKRVEEIRQGTAVDRLQRIAELNEKARVLRLDISSETDAERLAAMNGELEMVMFELDLLSGKTNDEIEEAAEEEKLERNAEEQRKENKRLCVPEFRKIWGERGNGFYEEAERMIIEYGHIQEVRDLLLNPEGKYPQTADEVAAWCMEGMKVSMVNTNAKGEADEEGLNTGVMSNTTGSKADWKDLTRFGKYFTNKPANKKEGIKSWGGACERVEAEAKELLGREVNGNDALWDMLVKASEYGKSREMTTAAGISNYILASRTGQARAAAEQIVGDEEAYYEENPEESGVRYSVHFSQEDLDAIKEREDYWKNKANRYLEEGNNKELLSQWLIREIDKESPLEVYADEVMPEVTFGDYYKSTTARFKNLLADDAVAAWNTMKEQSGYEWHKSPLSESEYLVDKSSGDIYRFSNHWGNVASCRWGLDKKKNSTRFQIGVCNIKDFTRWHNVISNPNFTKEDWYNRIGNNHVFDNVIHEKVRYSVVPKEQLEGKKVSIIPATSSDPFVSNAAKALESIKQEKATGEQWLAMLQKNGGLKAEEDKWIGLSDFLKGKKSVTKEELKEYIAENAVKVEEVEYDTKNNKTSAINPTRLEYTTEGLENKREIALTVPSIEQYNQNDNIHFGDAGEGRAVAWSRFGDTKDTEGNKVLVIDEIQSKRHQDGRERGYGETVNPNEIELEYSNDGSNYVKATYKGKEEGIRRKFNSDDEAKEYFAKVFTGSNKVPDAPFRSTWQELAMKRMLRYAAENGYDKMAWTTGTQQAERYDIGKVVKTIAVERYEAGSPREVNGFDISIITTLGNTIDLFSNEQGIVSEYEGQYDVPLSNIVGKELANKILNVREYSAIEGDNLRVGGEGMKGFYDQMLPRFMDKYGKKWGVKTYDIELDLPRAEDRVMHGIDITEEMKESVMQGQVMFSVSPAEDAEYMEAVESGDMEKAQRMVDEVAKKAGYNVEAYHGTNGFDFNTFKKRRHANGNVWGDGFYFAEDKKEAEMWGERAATAEFNDGESKLIDAYLSVHNPLELNGETIVNGLDAETAEKVISRLDEEYDAELIEAIRNNQDVENDYQGRSYSAVGDIVKELGYDAVQGYYAGSYHIMVFSPNQIKSAEAVTYDDEGKVIPLSERFSEGSEDIRYSVSPEHKEETNIIAESLVETERENSESVRFSVADDAAEARRAFENVMMNEPRYRGVGHEDETMIEFFNRYADWRKEKERLGSENEEANKEYERLFGAKVPYIPKFDKENMSMVEYLTAFKETNDAVQRFELVNDFNGALRMQRSTARSVKRLLWEKNASLEDWQRRVAKVLGVEELSSRYDVLNALMGLSSIVSERIGAYGKDQGLAVEDAVAAISHDAAVEMGEKKRQEVSGKYFKQTVRRPEKVVFNDNINGREVAWQPNWVWQNVDDIDTPEGNKRNGQLMSPQEVIELYLQAKDALEAENLNLPDRGMAGFVNQVGVKGSEEKLSARKIEAEFEKHISEEKVEALQRAVYNATVFAMDEMLRGQLITQEKYREVMMYDEATQTFRRRHYVPQRGWAFEAYLDETMFADAMRAAKGRETLATSPLTYIEIIAKSAITGAERNLAKQRLYNLAKEHERELSKEGNALQMARMYEFTMLDENTGEERVYETSVKPTEEVMARNKEIIKEHITPLYREVALRKAWIANAKKSGNTAKVNERQNEINDLYAQIEENKKKYGTIDLAERREFNDEKKYNPDSNKIVQVFVNGERYDIHVNEKAVARNINGYYDSENTNRLVDAWRKVFQSARFSKYSIDETTKFFSALKTQFNFIFATSNFARDAQFAFFMNCMEHDPAFAAKVFGYSFDSVKCIHNYIRGSMEGYAEKHPETAQLFKEFVEGGAITGYSFAQDIPQLREKLGDAIAKAERRIDREKAKGKKEAGEMNRAMYVLSELKNTSFGDKVDTVAEWAEYLSKLSELMTRFAQYRAVREEQMAKGVEDIPAAIREAKEITVNFNRSGEIAPFLGGLWYFANATLQGGYRVIRCAVKHPWKLAAYSLGWGLLGALMAAVQPDDPDEKRYIPDYVWRSYIVIGSFRMHMPHYFRTWYYLGANVTWALTGKKTWGEAMLDGISNMIDDNLPTPMNILSAIELNKNLRAQDEGGIDWGKSFTKWKRGVWASLIQPFTDLGYNMSFTGASIYKEPFNKNLEYNQTQLYYKSTDRLTVALCEWLFEATGGTAKETYDKQGKIELNPAKISYVVSSYLSGAPTEAYRLLEPILRIGAYGFNKLWNDSEEESNLSLEKAFFVGRYYQPYQQDRMEDAYYWDLKSTADNFAAFFKEKKANKDNSEEAMREYKKWRDSDNMRIYREMYGDDILKESGGGGRGSGRGGGRSGGRSGGRGSAGKKDTSPMGIIKEKLDNQEPLTSEEIKKMMEWNRRWDDIW